MANSEVALWVYQQMIVKLPHAIECSKQARRCWTSCTSQWAAQREFMDIEFHRHDCIILQGTLSVSFSFSHLSATHRGSMTPKSVLWVVHVCICVCMCVQERESLLRPQSAWCSYNHKASAMDTVMGILPQALLCGFSNKYWHAYSSSSLILWLQQLMPSWVFFLKPYFAASIMDTVMGILSSSSLILHFNNGYQHGYSYFLKPYLALLLKLTLFILYLQFVL